jgi:hypothetical protein
MNQTKYLKKFILVLIIFSTQIFAQDPVTLRLDDNGIASYQSIFIADFDFLQVGAVEDLFDIILTKEKGEVREATFTITLIQNNAEVLATIITNEFDIPASETPRTWTISNKELANETFSFDGVSNISISESKLEDTASDLQDKILASSQIPVGLYTLTSRMTYTYIDPVSNQPTDYTTNTSADINIVVSNPTLINLITPGVLLNSGFSYDVYSEQPILQWNGNSGDYEVLVFKKESEFSSVEDILNSEPIWSDNRSQINGALSIQYPDIDALPLEYGKTYVWMVRSFINTSSGENVINSEPWEFTLMDPSKAQGVENMAKQELEQLLRQLLGDNAEAVIRDLDGFAISSMRINGSTISTQELYQFIEKYRDQERQIYDLLIRSSN